LRCCSFRPKVVRRLKRVDGVSARSSQVVEALSKNSRRRRVDGGAVCRHGGVACRRDGVDVQPPPVDASGGLGRRGMQTPGDAVWAGNQSGVRGRPLTAAKVSTRWTSLALRRRSAVDGHHSRVER